MDHVTLKRAGLERCRQNVGVVTLFFPSSRFLFCTYYGYDLLLTNTYHYYY